MSPSLSVMALIVMLSFTGGAPFFISEPLQNDLNPLDDVGKAVWDFFVKKIVGTITSILGWIEEKLTAFDNWVDEHFFPHDTTPPNPINGAFIVIFNTVMVGVWFLMMRGIFEIAKWWIWILDILPII